MAGAKLRVKQLVEAAISRNLDESAVKIVYENDNLKNDRQDKCNTELVSQQECECIEHEQDLEPSIFQLSVNHDYISSRNNEPHTSRGIHPVTDPDIIEDSQFEQINTYKLPLRNKKINTFPENATFSEENYEDFSLGSDDVFIPESSPNSSTSQSSSEIDVRVSAKDLVVAHPPTSRIQENLLHHKKMLRVLMNMTLTLLHLPVRTRKMDNLKNVIYLENEKYFRLGTTNQKTDLEMKGLGRKKLQPLQERKEKSIYSIKIKSFQKNLYKKEFCVTKTVGFKFNLSFGYPKSDTCATCDAGDSNEEHKANYYAAVEAMQVDRKNLHQVRMSSTLQ
ncbi:unnamed protein product [Diatraea saccharalis]|uniref:Uncharacterized protein n=1 Tax=Diatraea saccharalis TaxID=40085 RepID=A0A9N9WGW9_9NEOP|nr:unnamed protein product [Diatraea saccharalis]